MNKTKVYVADTKVLENESVFRELYQTVSLARQQKIDAFLFEKDKRLCLAAELLLRKALLEDGIDQFEISYGAHGKPYINHAGIYFNLSHSGERVLCAVSNKEVGCDVEQIADIDLEIAKQFFCNEEYEQICTQKKEEQQNLFYRIWTRKESYMKATGLGAMLPLNSFCIKLEGDTIRVCHADSLEAYYFKEYHLKDGYQYTVCSQLASFEEIKVLSLI